MLDDLLLLLCFFSSSNMDTPVVAIVDRGLFLEYRLGMGRTVVFTWGSGVCPMSLVATLLYMIPYTTLLCTPAD